MMFGLTGQTGAGKSTVAGMLREAGFPVIDADKVTREVQTPGSPVLLQLAEAFGEEILLADGNLDRKRLASIAFADPEKLRMLNAITHPVIREEILRRIEALCQKEERIVLLDAPMLFESGLAAECRRVIAVIADESVRKARIISRDHLSEAEAMARIGAQQSKGFFMVHADYLIENTGDLELLRWEAGKLIACLKEIERGQR